MRRIYEDIIKLQIPVRDSAPVELQPVQSRLDYKALLQPTFIRRCVLPEEG